jgi:hypothetical protein
MRFREVERNIEQERLNVKKEDENFKKIKPEEEMTVEDAKAFWNELFAKGIN